MMPTKATGSEAGGVHRGGSIVVYEGFGRSRAQAKWAIAAGLPSRSRATCMRCSGLWRSKVRPWPFGVF